MKKKVYRERYKDFKVLGVEELKGAKPVVIKAVEYDEETGKAKPKRKKNK